MHGNTKACTIGGKAILNPASRVWGHTVSRDGATWDEWPGIDADDPKSDAPGVYSGNCALRDDGKPVCIYSNGHCSIGVCAYSEDWVHWSKTACMTTAPSPRSQTNHDSSIWRDGPGGTWYMLSGGCTYGGSNVPHGACSGTGQLWNSSDLITFEYMKAITPGGPGPYWELPYLLPFNKDGTAIDNYHHNGAAVYALLFGHGNAYYVGHYDDADKSFVPLGATPAPPPGPPPPPPTPPAPPAPEGTLLGAWSLANASGKASTAATTAPAAVISGARPASTSTGTVFYRGSSLHIPYFAGLAQPQGFTLSLMIQLNAPAKGVAQNSKILTKEDMSWGLEWWGGSTLNFYVRGPGAQPGMQGTEFRGVQANICAAADDAGGAGCEAEWVRVAVSYSASAGFSSNIAMVAGGKPLTQLPDKSPGTYHGPASATPGSGLETSGLAELALADIEIYSGAMTLAQMTALTAKPVPPPAPKPLPAPPAPHRPPSPPHPAGSGGAPPGWPAQNMSDAPDYYSFNPHATDTRGPNNTTRRLMFGWIEGPLSAAVGAKKVPYWQSAHSLMRDVTVSGASIVQVPAAGTYEPLRASAQPQSVGPIAVSKATAGKYLPSLKGDAMEIVATFSTEGATAKEFGVALRVESGFECRVTYDPAAKRISGSTSADITPQPASGTVELHIFLDRSIIEVYSAGVALTQRCMLPKGVTGGAESGLDVFAVGGSVKASVKAWAMTTMWQPVAERGAAAPSATAAAVVALAPRPNCTKLLKYCYQGTQMEIEEVTHLDPLACKPPAQATMQPGNCSSFGFGVNAGFDPVFKKVGLWKKGIGPTPPPPPGGGSNASEFRRFSASLNCSGSYTILSTDVMDFCTPFSIPAPASDYITQVNETAYTMYHHQGVQDCSGGTVEREGTYVVGTCSGDLGGYSQMRVWLTAGPYHCNPGCECCPCPVSQPHCSGKCPDCGKAQCDCPAVY